MTFLNTLTRNSDTKRYQVASSQYSRRGERLKKQKKLNSKFGHFPERENRLVKKSHKRETEKKRHIKIGTFIVCQGV